MFVDTSLKLATLFITVNTYLNACINQAPLITCTMHKDGLKYTGLNCYFAVATWFAGAGYILGRGNQGFL